MSNSPFLKNSNKNEESTFVAYMKSIFQPFLDDLKKVALFICLILFWILLSIVFWILPVSYVLRVVLRNDILVFIIRNIIFYAILIIAYYSKLICTYKMYHNF